jgi:uncharacterized membrane protein
MSARSVRSRLHCTLSAFAQCNAFNNAFIPINLTRAAALPVARLSGRRRVRQPAARRWWLYAPVFIVFLMLLLLALLHGT